MENSIENKTETVLFVIVPCYNEEKVLPITSELLLKEIRYLAEKEKISDKSRILFVDDGSTDSTWGIIKNLSIEDRHYIGISLSRNRGHQNAILAGLMEVKDKCDISITIDCDGQDDIEAVEKMVDAYLQGYDVVYGVRNERKKDSVFKRSSAQLFYKVLNKLGAEVIYNHADYRLLSKRVLEEFSNYREVNLFIRGLIPLIGFKSTSVFYERQERLAGKSHYPIGKMAGLAFDGITSLSIAPVRMIIWLGFIVSLFSFIGIIWVIIGALMGNTVTGWASLICIVCFLGGIQILSIGVIGEYVGKIYMEAKHRPRYVIEERTFDENGD